MCWVKTLFFFSVVTFKVFDSEIMYSYQDCIMISEAKTPPSFPKKITSLQQTEGQAVRFECRIAGSSPIEVSWLKDGEPLKEGGEFSMLYDDNTAVLQIERGQMRHSGEYTCTATNSVGSTSCRAKLTLQGLAPAPDSGATPPTHKPILMSNLMWSN